MTVKLYFDTANQVKLLGEINFDDIKELLRDFKQNLSPNSKVNVNLSELENSKTLILSLMFEMRRISAKKHIELSFSHTPQNLQNIAQLSGVDNFYVNH